MTLRAVLKSLDGLSEDLRKEYVERDGEFHLDVEGAEDTGALKRAKDHEKRARQAAEQRAKDLETQLQGIQDELDGLRKGAIPKADVEKLEASLKQRAEKVEKELREENARLSKSLDRTLVDGEALRLATEISKAPKLLLPHIRSRLTTEYDAETGEYVTRVLDEKGNVTDKTLADLKTEVLASKDFEAILVGSRASGGGAAGRNGGQGGARDTSKKDTFDYSAATPQQIAEHLKSKKQAEQGG